jgi:hypothetical protein
MPPHEFRMLHRIVENIVVILHCMRRHLAGRRPWPFGCISNRQPDFSKVAVTTALAAEQDSLLQIRIPRDCDLHDANDFTAIDVSDFAR